MLRRFNRRNKHNKSNIPAQFPFQRMCLRLHVNKQAISDAIYKLPFGTSYLIVVEENWFSILKTFKNSKLTI